MCGDIKEVSMKKFNVFSKRQSLNKIKVGKEDRNGLEYL
jgi:hypothetical protein